MENREEHAILMRRATYASVAVALCLIIFKILAFLVTGSVALLSSLVDSLLDCLASILNLFAVRQSLVPADDEHRFGHGKAEPLAGLGQAAFITGSSIFLVLESINRIVNPKVVEQGEIGLLVMLFSLVATIALVTYQSYVARKTGSVAIKADSIHYFSDIALNTGVIIALLLTTYVGWELADPVIALLIALYIVSSAWKIIKQSLDQLMDRELLPEQRQVIIDLLESQTAIAGYHDLRTRTSGTDVFIQLHLDIDGSISLGQAHAIASEVESSLRTRFPTADILIHQDPVDRD